MSNYRYTLSDYHAIKEADITINGITVLAGENGCGKSTLIAVRLSLFTLK